jgi:hypothetical protein
MTDLRVFGVVIRNRGLASGKRIPNDRTPHRPEVAAHLSDLQRSIRQLAWPEMVAGRTRSSRPHLAAVLREGRKSANIYASLGFIRGIPVK